jgi:hypothetical protein
MTMTDDLVKRLRAIDHLSVEDCFCQSALYDQAAARIEALTAERNQAWKMVAEADARLGQALGDALKDKADNARLRAALTFYADEENYKSHLSTDPCGCCTTWDEPIIHIYGDDSGHIARAALTGKEPSHE